MRPPVIEGATEAKVESHASTSAARREPARETPANSEASGAARRSRSLWTLISVMIAVGAAFHTGALRQAGPLVAEYDLPWWILAVGFAVTGVFVIHLQVRREAHSITLSEVPLVLGLGLASPQALIVGRLVGSAAALVLHRRQPLKKLAFNLALCYLETAVALSVYRWLLGSQSPVSPLGWLSALAAVVVVLAVGWSSVTLAISIHDQRRSAQAMLRTLSIGTVAGLSAGLVGLVFLMALWHDWRSSWIVMVLGSLLYLFVRAFGSLSKRYQDLQSLYAFAREVDRPVLVEKILPASLAQVRELLRADVAEVALVVDGAGGAGECVRLGTDGTMERTPIEPKAMASLIHAAGVDRGDRRFTSTRGDRRLREHYGTRGFDSGIVAPLNGPDGIVGVLAAGNRLGPVPAFDPDDLGLLDLLAKHTSLTLDRSKLVGSLKDEAARREYQALHDELTALPNRVSFTGSLERALGQLDGEGRQVAVLMIDLDRFKEVNDTLGHHYGDVLLQEVSQRLKDELDSADSVARFGGDEFAVLLAAPATIADVVDVAHRLGAALARPYQLAGLPLKVSGSIGVAIAPDHGRDAASVLQHADVAMYTAKASGSVYEIYSPERDSYSPSRLALAGELRTAIDEGQLEVHYQPKVRMTDQRVIGVEALVRWPHPHRQAVSPEEFVAIAERTGLIQALTSSVIRTALADVAAWRDTGHELGVALNVSARSMVDAEFPAAVAATLNEFQIDPSMVTLEITETTIITDSARATAVLDELNALGVRLSIDDFGTGYSSVSLLRQLPIHEIKVDRSFVMELAVDDVNAVIVRSIIELAHGLGITVVAEGVENQLSWNLLAGMGCDEAQGYYVCRPLRATALTRWLPDSLKDGSGAVAESLEGQVAHIMPARRGRRGTG